MKVKSVKKRRHMQERKEKKLAEKKRGVKTKRAKKRATKRTVSTKTENAGLRLEARKTKGEPGSPEAPLW